MHRQRVADENYSNGIGERRGGGGLVDVTEKLARFMCKDESYLVKESGIM